MKLAVYGYTEYGIRILYKLLEKKDVDQVIFVDNNVSKIGTKTDNIGVVSLYSFLRMYQQKEILKIIIPDYSLSTIRSMKNDLRKNGVKAEDVLIVETKSFIEKLEGLVKFSDYKCYKVPFVQYLSFEASEKCNLNCKRCDHFSNLIDNDNQESADEFTHDLELLSSKIERIGTFSFLGGEPLLNTDLYKLIYVVKSYYPDTQIIVLTNGLLLKQISTELVQAIKETQTIVRMTLYPPMKDKIDDIVQFMRNKEIKFEISKAVDEFWTQLNIEGNSDSHKMLNKCVNSDCFVLKKGKLAKCPITMNISIFNNYFRTEIPQDVLDLSDDSITPEVIHEYLYNPIKTCAYCGREKYYEWERTSGKVKVEEMLCADKIV
ncbi:radical SAM protein [Butyrivibrio fibrisolvens]|uniref:radical SAM protein n=1 Tax=Butyrivibrio fibrisolvens TaxID=831 RepID=UPI0004164EC9|nr:radical SAM protein [Butyrivibrio fibrisolvens]